MLIGYKLARYFFFYGSLILNICATISRKKRPIILMQIAFGYTQNLSYLRKQLRNIFGVICVSPVFVEPVSTTVKTQEGFRKNEG